jgi:hypothetical protein
LGVASVEEVSVVGVEIGAERIGVSFLGAIVQAPIRAKHQIVKANFAILINTSKENLDYIQEVNSDQVIKIVHEI